MKRKVGDRKCKIVIEMARDREYVEIESGKRAVLRREGRE
jgi:hypothetical protein